VAEIGNVAAKDINQATEGRLSDPPKGLPESFTDVPGATNTKAKTLAIIFTCKVCNTRSAKQVSTISLQSWIWRTSVQNELAYSLFFTEIQFSSQNMLIFME
jgi:hypothetical protein